MRALYIYDKLLKVQGQTPNGSFPLQSSVVANDSWSCLMIDRMYSLIFYFILRSFTMKWSLALEIFLLILRSVTCDKCKLTNGVRISHNGPISTVSCSGSRLGIEYNNSSNTFTKSLFLRVFCNEEGEFVGLGDNEDSLFFCTENSCKLSKSENLDKLYFNKTVIMHQNQIYYCFESQWFSLNHGEIPVELRNTNTEKKKNVTHVWTPVQDTDEPKFQEAFEENKLLDIDESHFTNDSKLSIRYSRQPNADSFDLCLIAIILSIVFSVLFVITIVLLISSRCALRQKLKNKLLTPIRYNVIPQPLTYKEIIGKSEPYQDQYILASELASKSEVSSYEPFKKPNKDLEV